MRTAIRLLSAACAGTALLACGSAGVAPPAVQSAAVQPAALPVPAQNLSALERACVLDPLDPMHWERLAQALERQGQDARAALMRRQAQSLRDHDVQRDYAILAEQSAGVEPRLPMARIEVVPVGGAMVLVRRVAAPVVASALPARSAAPGPSRLLAPLVSPGPAADGAPPVRLEISNGNGVTGMAAALARTLRGDDVKVVRLTNVRPFVVPVSRVEYRADRQAAAQVLATRLGMTMAAPSVSQQRGDVRIVLGRDLLSPAALRQRYLK